MKKITVYEMDKLGLKALENELFNLQNQRDVLNATYGESTKDKCEFKKVITDINLVKYNIEMLSLKELRSNVKGRVTETSYDSDLGFTIKIQSDNKIHIYKGIYELDSAPSDQVNIGERLGMVKEQLYYEVQDAKSDNIITIVIGANDDSIFTDKVDEFVMKVIERMSKKLK